MFERKYTSGRCSTSSVCNSSSADVTVSANDWCQCTTYHTKYVIGAEQMSIVINHDSMVDFDSGKVYTASSSNAGAGFIKMVTILRAENGTDIGKWETPQDVEIPLASLLDMVDVNLDAINPASLTSTVTGNKAYYRMTGAQIVLDMDYKNFDLDGIETLGIINLICVSSDVMNCR